MRISVSGAAMLLIVNFFDTRTCSAQQADRDDLKKLNTTMAQKWIGEGPCDGQLTLNSDQTYQRQFYGPGGISCEGTWRIDWKQLPPVLVLRCTKSDFEDRIMKSYRWRVVKLDTQSLQLDRGEGKNPVHYRISKD